MAGSADGDAAVPLKYYTNGEIRAEIAAGIGADPSRYGPASKAGLPKTQLVAIARRLHLDDADLEAMTLHGLYRHISRSLESDFPVPNANNWMLPRAALKEIHGEIVGGSL